MRHTGRFVIPHYCIAFIEYASGSIHPRTSTHGSEYCTNSADGSRVSQWQDRAAHTFLGDICSRGHGVRLSRWRRSSTGSLFVFPLAFFGFACSFQGMKVLERLNDAVGSVGRRSGGIETLAGPTAASHGVVRARSLRLNGINQRRFADFDQPPGRAKKVNVSSTSRESNGHKAGA